MTTTEQTYVNSYRDVIDAVCSVDGFVTAAHQQQLDKLETHIGIERCEELREAARRSLGLS